MTAGLGFYDVLKRFDIPKPSRLGFATLYTAQQALQHDPRWADFKFVFYTESDQILHVRDVNQLLHIAGNGDPITRVGLTMQHLVGEPVASWGTGSMAVTNPITELMT